MLPRRPRRPVGQRSAALAAALLWLPGLLDCRRPALRTVPGRASLALAAPPTAPPPASSDSASSRYSGVTWSKRRWMWEVRVQDHPEPRWIHCGSFETEEEAAKAHDCAQLALDQEFPDRAHSWKRNLPRETIFQDEVDALRVAIDAERQRQNE
mmetsp:Transcript_50661/g.151543  ORF Transcript_50661/g.151543 Transcript_50661/m.151543 type:complete len:154 (-) Transcript_50661:81-542(-)